MEKSAADEKILSYNDVVLRRSDLDILNGPYFLNDRLIEFYFSHLSSAHPSQEILLVTPAIAFWIANCPDNESLKDFLEPFKLRDKKLVIFPVNDNDDVNLAEGGNHWSLLAYERNSNVFVHHDSSGCINKWHAMQLYKTLVGFICDSNVAGHARYIEYADSPRQVNGYDCGVYVLAATRVICCWYESSESKDSNGLWLTSLKEQVNPLAAAEMRTEILGLIRELMAGKCTSSSSKGS